MKGLFKKLFLPLLCLLVLPGCAVPEREIGTVAEYGGAAAELLDGEIVQLAEPDYSYDGPNQGFNVSVRFTNFSEEPRYMLESFAVRAYQGEEELFDATDVNLNEDHAQLIRSVRDGGSTMGVYAFKLKNEQDIELRIYTPTADEKLLARKIYPYQSEGESHHG